MEVEEDVPGEPPMECRFVVLQGKKLTSQVGQVRVTIDNAVSNHAELGVVREFAAIVIAR